MFWPWLLISVLTFLQALYLLEVNPDSAAAIIFPLDAHVILGGALAFLVVMRTDASMNRWWEARCSWQELMNSCISIGCQTAPALRASHCALSLVVFMDGIRGWWRGGG